MNRRETSASRHELTKLDIQIQGLTRASVLTLNRDKIEPREISDQITLDVPGHTVARFSKLSPFLKKNYQEI
jgi:hypothetical protein